MSYCRFENTYHDLADCADHIGDEIKNEYEIRYRSKLIDVCREIVKEVDEKAREDEKAENFFNDRG